ncbi:MAG: hypothetical protein QM784_14545 [Polyangiaceae bacterium]
MLSLEQERSGDGSAKRPRASNSRCWGRARIAQEGFREGKVVEAALAVLDETAQVLGATTAVFVAAADFAQNRANKSALKSFLQTVKARYDRVVFEVGAAWKPDDADALAEETGTVAARDPLQHGLSKREVAYYRLPGPAGHKSRYEDPAIERLAEICISGKDQQATYVFTNVDMFADAKRFRKAARL